jgi:hypothetical protein
MVYVVVVAISANCRTQNGKCEDGWLWVGSQQEGHFKSSLFLTKFTEFVPHATSQLLTISLRYIKWKLQNLWLKILKN